MEWLPQGHLAYFVLEVVQELDLRAIEDSSKRRMGAASVRTRRG
jgi:hypothetical protein